MMQSDVTSNARLAVMARFFYGFTIREELVKPEVLPTSTSGNEICKVVTKPFNESNIDILKIVSVTTDGAPNIWLVGMWDLLKFFIETIGYPVIPFH